jgi:hypothetical protein
MGQRRAQPPTAESRMARVIVALGAAAGIAITVLLVSVLYSLAHFIVKFW